MPAMVKLKFRRTVKIESQSEQDPRVLS
eukprot:SAG22_NODE_1180_length_5238_cov_2.463125_9_plen_27_part_01